MERKISMNESVKLLINKSGSAKISGTITIQKLLLMTVISHTWI